MSRTYAGLLIKDGAIERVEIDALGDGAQSIHNLIGDTFSSCFALPGYGKRHRAIIGYCDDRYFDKGLAPNVILDCSIYEKSWPVLGPIVVAGAEPPDTTSLVELEIASLRLAPPLTIDLGAGMIVRMPVLYFLPGYDVL